MLVCFASPTCERKAYTTSAHLLGSLVSPWASVRHLHTTPVPTRLLAQPMCSDCCLHSCRSAATRLLMTVSSCLSSQGAGAEAQGTPPQCGSAARHSASAVLTGNGIMGEGLGRRRGISIGSPICNTTTSAGR
jgi:hypothetical protein